MALELNFRDIDRDDERTLSSIADLWLRAHNANKPCLPLARTQALAIVRDNDGAGAPVLGHVLVRLVAVDAPFRRCGVGATTVVTLLHLARERGFTHAELWVGTSNATARRLYERLGFHASGRSKLDDRGEPIEHMSASLNTSANDGRSD